MPLNLTAVGRAENPEKAPKEGRKAEGAAVQWGKRDGEEERGEEGKEGRNGMNVSDNDGAEEEVACLTFLLLFLLLLREGGAEEPTSRGAIQ